VLAWRLQSNASARYDHKYSSLEEVSIAETVWIKVIKDGGVIEFSNIAL
jgi:hypothetical protein